MAPAGFVAAGSSWAFRRHVLERRDRGGYAAFMQQLLPAVDWAFWQHSNRRTKLLNVIRHKVMRLPTLSVGYVQFLKEPQVVLAKMLVRNSYLYLIASH